jgi:hypothetical protein
MIVMQIAVFGHEKMHDHLGKAPMEIDQLLTRARHEEATKSLRHYRQNLSGSVPSTASRPLPVGVRSGKLLGSARLHQGKFGFNLYNNASHAKYIEFGTSKMVARRPLGDVMDELDARVAKRADNVSLTITGK